MLSQGKFTLETRCAVFRKHFPVFHDDSGNFKWCDQNRKLPFFLGQIGACASTTTFLDYKMLHFQIFSVMALPTNDSVLDNFPLCPQIPPPQNCKFYFYCRLAVSEIWGQQRPSPGKCLKIPGNSGFPLKDYKGMERTRPSQGIPANPNTIRVAQPSARLSEEICLSEGSAGVSPRALWGLSEGSAGSLRGFCGALSAGVCGVSPRFFGGSDPMLVTLGNC